DRPEAHARASACGCISTVPGAAHGRDLMDAAGLTARQAADQLGHAKVSMTQDNYFGRKVARTGAVRVMEVFGNGERTAGHDRGQAL
ncbi:MAG: hypothetical protein ACRDRK_01340, partial [Pseudonocardia sp.]